MSKRRQEIVDQIIGERERNFLLPDSENDSAKTANDWIMTAIFYLAQARQRDISPPDRAEYDDNLIKASAIILAALEHSDLMASKSMLKDHNDC